MIGAWSAHGAGVVQLDSVTPDRLVDDTPATPRHIYVLPDAVAYFEARGWRFVEGAKPAMAKLERV